MKKYIGTKKVQARPMTIDEWSAYTGNAIIFSIGKNKEGYLVEYEESEDNAPNHRNHKGYISWSPKKVFEKAYKEISPLDKLKYNLLRTQDTVQVLDNNSYCMPKFRVNEETKELELGTNRDIEIQFLNNIQEGVTVEQLLEVCRLQLLNYVSFGDKHAEDTNAAARKIKEAIMYLNNRTFERGVEGTLTTKNK